MLLFFYSLDFWALLGGERLQEPAIQPTSYTASHRVRNKESNTGIEKDKSLEAKGRRDNLKLRKAGKK